MPCVSLGWKKWSSCHEWNPTCTPMNLTTYRLIPGGTSANVSAHLARPLPAFGAWEAAVPPGPAVPPGSLANAVPLDRAGAPRTAGKDAPGAYALA